MLSKRFALAAVTTLAVAAPTAASAAPTSAPTPAGTSASPATQQSQVGYGARHCRPTPWGWRCWRSGY